MDPDATFDRIFAALADGNPSEAIDAIDDLRAWLNSGGFVPTVNGSQLSDLLGGMSVAIRVQEMT